MLVIDENNFVPNPDYIALEALIHAGLLTEHDKTYQFNSPDSAFRKFWNEFKERTNDR